MWSSNPPSAYLVLALANFGGGVAKGITGFGSAIINLCMWIAFKVCGVHSGTLAQAVVSEALSSTLIAPWLLYVTRAPSTADLKTVSAIALFVSLASPVGAAVLAKLDAKRVELLMAVVLAAIIATEQVGRCVSAAGSRQAYDSGGGGGGRKEAAAAAGEGQDTDGDCVVCVGPAVDEVAEGGGGGGGRFAAGGEALAAAQPSNSGPSRSGRSLGHGAKAAVGEEAPELRAPLLQDAGPNSRDSGGYGGDGREGDPSGIVDSEASSSSQPVADGADCGNGDGGGSEGGRGCSAGACCFQLGPRGRQWARILAVGAVAGTLSGLMEGLTGMNGPPIMIMYRALDTPKQVVRGNNAWLNLLQMRLGAYWAMGLLPASDAQLFVVCCASGLLGAAAGDRLSYCMGQAAFQSALGILMALCCVLMFASGLGITD